MATPLPAGVQTTLITGRFMQVVVDNHDPDTKPEGVPLANLKISIIPSVEGRIIRNTAAGVSMVIEGFVATTDSDGHLGIRPPGAPAFQRGMEIPSSDSSGITPKGWTYKVTVDETTGQRRRLAQFDIVAQADVPIDLTTVIPVPANPGVDLAEWERIVGDIERIYSDTVQVANGIPVLVAEQVGLAVDAEDIPGQVTAAVDSMTSGLGTRVLTLESQFGQISRTNHSMGEGAPSGSAPVGWWYTDVSTGDVWRNE